jgi:AcrR family transcriptional regulator
MPTPAKTSNEEIILAARKLIEAHGKEFSMATLAEEVGIRAPSLYKRFRDRSAILAALEENIIFDLGEAVKRALTRKTKDPIKSAARAYRAFALKNPQSYLLLFSQAASSNENVQEARRLSVVPILAHLESNSNTKNTLSAARTLTAYLHGFITMELSGAFRLGGNVEEAFEDGIDTLSCLMER